MHTCEENVDININICTYTHQHISGGVGGGGEEHLEYADTCKKRIRKLDI